ncbi:Erythronolide synthase., Oleoyl-(acyl-carrier-protein) hydrolase [Gloeothece citriformis PCC 7424]|uniref:Erythronolide synthase., Oleoyl-(Acyl-carrier-protein) hydrolase n=1 Tax=Gloeothece citriformis (strain PCC 7424) TaxID=65393 RepID=B7K7V0_GLOC7|nr:type I polyketide synthase [Gloeothece citriformis]ACK71146.1 Erythronolide synthase., Oleoyl-(acyl-carrier-protein) hydrolase [Gloeothece citriformis PCC 7424]
MGLEPIAIIGLSCRFPKSPNLADYWQLLRNGIDAITEVPEDRWPSLAYFDSTPATPGKMTTRWGGFLDKVDEFDANFFQISPREAQLIDPQQRLLLEVTWEALENAAIVPETLADSQTGVFIGISNSDYNKILSKDIFRLNAYYGTGTALSIAANRLSYFFNLKGPSLAIDTACSSSLVAIHYACQSLANHESNLCIAGGVNLILSPEVTISFSHAKMMASDGRCKTFDARADGYVRGEGCGVIILKRLQDALNDGDNIYGIIRGSAVNQDGLTNGLSAPNGLSQQAVIRQALKAAKLKPDQISYVEAHGTGTPLGDPQEFKALTTVLKEGRSSTPCWIGSVKTNIGHLESAAGIAGLIKVVLALQHRLIPPHLHLENLNPYISLKNTPFSIPTQGQPWEVDTPKRYGGISSFGFGGTNCHLILEEAPAKSLKTASSSQNQPQERPLHLLTLSAKTEPALLELARRYHHHLVSSPTLPVGDLCYSANTGRTQFEHRLAVLASSTEQLREKLENFVNPKTEVSGTIEGKVSGRKPPKIAFLFTGQGSQYIGMGRQLYQTELTFRSNLDTCEQILRPYLNKSLLDILYSDNGELDTTAYTQPALFALEYALAQLWMSWGVKPTAVMGHSLGEYVAACVAGVFSLEDALKLVAQRAAKMQALPPNGLMIVVSASEDWVKSVIAPYVPQVAIAASNGPNNVVISGQSQEIESIKTTLEAQGIKVTPLKVSHAFHSSLMKPMIEEFRAVAQTVTYSKPQIKLISNVTGQVASPEIATPEYWCRHILEPVRFAAGMETLAQQGCRVFIECGPKATLLGMGCACLPEAEKLWLASLRPQREDWQQILESLSHLFIAGVPLDWASFDKDYARRRLSLPTYPFRRQRYWIEESTSLNSASDLESLSLNLLKPEKINPLVQQLELSGEFSESELKLLPKLASVLAEYYQKHLKEDGGDSQPSSMKNGSSMSLNGGQSPIATPEKKSIQEQYLSANSQERKPIIRTYFCQLLNRITGISQTDIQWQNPLSNLGIDSLMASQLRKEIETDLGVAVPVEFLANLSLEQFLEQIILLMEKQSPSLSLPATNSSNLWFPWLGKNPQARLRVFCFPYAGAGASLFREWSKDVPPDIEICPVQLPGRENRFQDPPFTNLKALIQTLGTLIMPHLDIPFAFFGHSLGGLLGFELARELRRQKASSPVHLFVSASRAPQIPDFSSPIHTLPDPEFKQAIERFKGTPKEVLENAELMALFLPTLRSDFALLETYFYSGGQPLECPITAFGGLEDSQISRELLEPWHKQTQSHFQLTLIPGDHFFLQTARQKLLSIIVETLVPTLTVKKGNNNHDFYC